MPATALRAFRAQLVGLAAMVTAILSSFGHLALAWPVCAFVIDLHAEVASLFDGDIDMKGDDAIWGVLIG
jgi:hypothetical protein